MLALRGIDGPGFPGATFAAALPCAGALCGWGLRRARRMGALLGLLTLAGTVWLIAGRGGSLDALPDAPWGPLVAVFPRWDTGSTAEVVVTAAVGAVVVGLLVREWRGGRRAMMAA